MIDSREKWAWTVAMVVAVLGGCTTTPTSSVESLSATSDAGVAGDGEKSRFQESSCTCRAGTWDHDRRRNTPCVPWTTCQPGTRVVRRGSEHQDRVCGACAVGTFSDAPNSTSCRPFQTCVPGTYVARAGNPRSDRVCTACAAGSFSTSMNASACMPVRHCAPGSYVAVPATPRTDAVCAACASGTFASSVDASVCAAWAVCEPGEYVASTGTSSANRVCATCADGTYSTDLNSSTCRPAGVCMPGTRQTRAATRTSPVVCEDCAVGSYCPGGAAPAVLCGSGTWDDDASAASPCVAWTSCSAGFQVATSGDATSDRTCVACASGTYSATMNATACVAWRDCIAGERVAASGTALTDRACASCADGEVSTTANATSCSASAWVLSYFGPNQDVPNDSLHLAYSMDGLHWAPLAYNQPAYQLAGMGTNHIRDPFLFRKNDGTFVYVATDWTLAENSNGYWSHPSPRVVVADSVDLVTFNNPRLLTLTNLPGPGGGPMHAWAPEIYWDSARSAYAIVWSGNDPSDSNRIYVSYTLDFQTVLNPTPDVLFDPGYSSIDATVERANGRSYLFFKDETDGNGPPDNRGKDIQIARAPTSALTPGSFSMWSSAYVTRGAEQTVRMGTEGPFAIHQTSPDRWVLYADFYGNGGVFGAWTTTSLDADPSSWTALSASEYHFPSGVRHAHAVRVSTAELDALIAHYGVGSRLRTTYSEGGVPFYVAHSWFHGIITTLDDRGRGQLPDDFVWKVVPGLADPSDPSLVSFESVGFPGRYLRIDSADPNRYPTCGDGSNRSWALCWVAPSERNHLTWLDGYADSAAFRADATFRRTPALNGDPSMVSLQWYPEPTRYLRHIAYQLFGTPISGGVQSNDASFVIERE